MHNLYIIIDLAAYTKEMVEHFIRALAAGHKQKNKLICAYICTAEDLIQTQEELLATYEEGEQVVQGLVYAGRVVLGAGSGAEIELHLVLSYD